MKSQPDIDKIYQLLRSEDPSRVRAFVTAYAKHHLKSLHLIEVAQSQRSTNEHNITACESLSEKSKTHQSHESVLRKFGAFTKSLFDLESIFGGQIRYALPSLVAVALIAGYLGNTYTENSQLKSFYLELATLSLNVSTIDNLQPNYSTTKSLSLNQREKIENSGVQLGAVMAGFVSSNEENRSRYLGQMQNLKNQTSNAVHVEYLNDVISSSHSPKLLKARKVAEILSKDKDIAIGYALKLMQNILISDEVWDHQKFINWSIQKMDERGNLTSIKFEVSQYKSDSSRAKALSLINSMLKVTGA